MTLIKVGPAGKVSESSMAWEEKDPRSITQIFISYGADYIKSLQFQLVKDGNLGLSKMHGGPNSPKFSTIKLNNLSEYIIGVSGLFGYSRSCSQWGILSLTIETNKSKYGPFGSSSQNKESDDEEFDFQFGPTNQFGGFYGTYTRVLMKSIGVYVNPT